jgi:hypothetical protein
MANGLGRLPGRCAMGMRAVSRTLDRLMRRSLGRRRECPVRRTRVALGTCVSLGRTRRQAPPHDDESAEEGQGPQGVHDPTDVGGRCGLKALSHG